MPLSSFIFIRNYYHLHWINRIISAFNFLRASNNANKVEDTIPTHMKYLIVGLGNIGTKYDNTRHNIGFDVVDALAKAQDVEFSTEKLGDIAEFRHKGRSFTLLKPSTYMNLSGKAINYWLQKLKITPQNLMVIVDDMHIPFGKLRVRGKGSDGGHNGLKNIQEFIGSKYPRLRFGIGNDFPKGRQIDFVLGEWSNEEQDQLPELIEAAQKIIISFATIGLERTMSSFN